MARISFPDAGLGPHIDWALQRPEMAVGMGKLSEAVYGNTRLGVREREAARWTIALINHCVVCQDTRAEKGPEADIDDEFFDKMRPAYADDEIADLVICCGMWLGMGRAMAVVGVPAPDERILV